MIGAGCRPRCPGRLYPAIAFPGAGDPLDVFSMHSAHHLPQQSIHIHLGYHFSYVINWHIWQRAVHRADSIIYTSSCETREVYHPPLFWSVTLRDNPQRGWCKLTLTVPGSMGQPLFPGTIPSVSSFLPLLGYPLLTICSYDSSALPY